MKIKIFNGDGVREDIYLHFKELVQVCTEKKDYPSIRFKEEHTEKPFNPIFEKTMSLNDLDINEFISYIEYQKNIKYSNPVFFFCFNFSNYYHFIYDTIPYIISYRKLKLSEPKLKLLVPDLNFKKFVKETFEILNLSEDDFLELDKNTIYERFYFSDSFTHGDNSNLPPHILLRDLYDEMVNTAKLKIGDLKYSNKIYISRRTWVNKDLTNIGTNYTTRRKMLNEDELVSELNNNGFEEIFTENLSMVDKIILFNNATNIIGPIGGGLCNCVFCNEFCTLIAIISPTFLDVNYRFIHSLPKKLILFDKTFHENNEKFKKYQRVLVKEKNIIGEISNIEENKLHIKGSKNLISGWNDDDFYEEFLVNTDECTTLDQGLNSPFYINIPKFMEEINL